MIMTQLIATSIVGSGALAATVNIGTLADTLIVKEGGKQRLVVTNNTGVSALVTLLGDTATTVPCAGLGDPVDVSAGYQFTVADQEVFTLSLASISAYLPDSENEPDLTADQSGLEYILLEG
jgi:hypothetical protein